MLAIDRSPGIALLFKPQSFRLRSICGMIGGMYDASPAVASTKRPDTPDLGGTLGCRPSSPRKQWGRPSRSHDAHDALLRTPWRWRSARDAYIRLSLDRLLGNVESI